MSAAAYNLLCWTVYWFVIINLMFANITAWVWIVRWLRI